MFNPHHRHLRPHRAGFGRNSAPPGILGGIFGSSEPRSRCATFVHPRLLMVRPPAAAIRDLLVFGRLGDLEKFCRSQKRQKVDFPGLGGRSGRNTRRPKFDRMLNADPLNPVCGPMCLWGPRYGRFGGAWGRFVGWGPVFSG